MFAPVLPRRASRRALLAEDDAATASVLAHLLTRKKLTVSRCSDGQTAAERLAHQTFDLVLAGANLPGVNGLDLLRTLARRPADDRPPVILLAWPGNDALLAQAFREGAAEVLVRPFSLVEVGARIERLLVPAEAATL